MRFHDRRDAGRQLAGLVELVEDIESTSAIVFGIARGGMPVAFEVASRLGAELEVFVARKVGALGQPELGVAAVAEVGDLVVGPYAVGLRAESLTARAEDERLRVREAVQRYRQGRPLPEVQGRDVILVDDGLATGITAEAALRGLLSLGPRRLILAAPVAAPETVARLSPLAQVVAVLTPAELFAVGQFYEDFSPTSDDEVIGLLTRG